MTRGRKKIKIKEELKDKPFSEYRIPDEFSDVVVAKESDPILEKTPVAEPNDIIVKTETTEALISTRKFIGNTWWVLSAGKLITAPKEIIESLRRGKFVK